MLAEAVVEQVPRFTGRRGAFAAEDRPPLGRQSRLGQRDIPRPPAGHPKAARGPGEGFPYPRACLALPWLRGDVQMPCLLCYVRALGRVDRRRPGGIKKWCCFASPGRSAEPAPFV